MNKLNLIALLLISGIITATAQRSNAIQKVYDKYENEDNVLSLSLSKNLTDVLDTDFDWGDDLKNIEGDISKMSTMIISKDGDSQKMLLQIKRDIKKLGYSNLDYPDEEKSKADEQTFLFTKGKGGKYSEIHVLVIDHDGSGVLFSMFGNFIVKNAS